MTPRRSPGSMASRMVASLSPEMPRSPLLSSASAYYRLAAKARRAGNYQQAKHYEGVADRKMAEYRRNQEAAERRRALAATSIRPRP